jgi:hypothetical protein
MRADPDKIRRLRRVLVLASAGIFILLLLSCWFHEGVNDGTHAVWFGGAKVMVWRGIVHSPSWFNAGVGPFECALAPSISHNASWSSYEVVVPLWPVLAIGLLATWRVRRTELLARRDTWVACGYDRRGLAIDVRCPECGTIPAT